MHEVFSTRAQEAFDGVLALVRVAVTSQSRQKVPEVVLDLLNALEAQVSESGNALQREVRVVDMGMWVTPDEAGQAVGYSGRRVRQLCAAGLVSHRRVGAGRYLVDVESLAAHLRRDSAS